MSTFTKILCFCYLEPTEPSLYYIKINVVNEYGYDVDVRSNTDTIQDVIVSAGETRDITGTTNLAEYFVVRVYDRRDGIPIMINGSSYVKITPSSSPQFVYNIEIEPGKS